jgi:ABC-type nitrate/sulfonate/bicarbonate transport system substrate-binding protein
LLRKHGIDGNAVVYIPVGFGATRLLALQTGAVDAAPLGAGDFAQLKQPKGHMLGDTEKEIRFAYVGLAVSNRLLARQPHLVERYLRSVIKGRIRAPLSGTNYSDLGQIHATETRVQ